MAEPGGEVILLMPCVGWLLFSSLPVAYYAAWTHMSVSRLGYMELMRLSQIPQLAPA